MKPVAVIGAGITGLTAAYRLTRQGIPVVIYEAGARAGGMIRTIHRDGYTVECGPSSIMDIAPEIGALIRDLGLDEQKISPNPQATKNFIVRAGKTGVLPRTAFGFACSRLFSTAAKFRLCAEPFHARADGDEALSHFVTRRLGREFLDYAINPFVAGIYAGDPARLSMRHAFPKLHAAEQRYGSLTAGKFFGARGRRKRQEKNVETAARFSFGNGLQVLTEALQTDLKSSLRFRSPVRVISRNWDGWEVETDQTVPPHKHSAVLLAAPAHRLARITLRAGIDTEFEPLARIHYPPVAIVALGFRREDVAHPLDGFGMLIPEVEGLNLLGTTFSSTIFPGRAPAGHVLLTSFAGGRRNPELALCDTDELREATLSDLRAVLGVKGEPVFEYQTLIRRAIPQYEMEFEALKTMMNDIETTAPGLFFAGNYRDGISLSNSIVSGDQAAKRIAWFREHA